MRIFLSEYLTSGALAGGPLPPSLAREGLAMRNAMAEDLAAVPGVEVVLTSDPRTPPCPAAECIASSSAEDESHAFERLCRECDATLVIAPEVNGELGRRCGIAADLCPRLFNCSAAAIALCSDKLALAYRLQSAGVPTIPTQRGPRGLHTTGACGVPPFPLVIKPRFGAGSQSTWLCRDQQELRAYASEYDWDTEVREPILQPYVSGRALSVGAIFDSSNREPYILPVAEQHLSEGGRFAYLGGSVPAAGCDVAAIRRLVQEAAETIDGLLGYVGFDILLPDDSAEPLLVEINPRLTTSYVGYRRLSRQNLAAVLLGREAWRNEWREGRARYACDGVVTEGAEPAPGQLAVP